MENGEVVEGEEQLRTFITNQYKSLFSTHAGTRANELLQKVQRKVSQEMNDFLLKTFQREEVKEALDSIGDLKAPGPDGMPSIFYKRFWSLISSRVQDEVLTVLNGGAMPAGWNSTTVVLIPKTKNPDRIKDLRPISLCNVLYKLISKVLANRLKVILPDIISLTRVPLFQVDLSQTMC